MEIEKNREDRWQEIMNEYDNFFYGDDGLFIASLMDNELEKYNWNFDKIKDLIKKLKDFKSKYGEFEEKEKTYLLEKRAILLEMKTLTNGIDEFYKKMSNIYKFIEDY